MIFKKIRQILKSKHPHFIYLDYKIYKRWNFLFSLVVLFNKNYKLVKIFRKKYKYHRNIVIIGLRYYGRNVKRRTNGFAKEFLEKHPGSKCLYCKDELTPENISADHIIPVSKGGNNAKVNLVACCKDCNGERGDRDFQEYLKRKNKEWSGKFI
jgi:5-methylcytosine-specific restriction endonuclease McrA